MSCQPLRASDVLRGDDRAITAVHHGKHPRHRTVFCQQRDREQLTKFQIRSFLDLRTVGFTISGRENFLVQQRAGNCALERQTQIQQFGLAIFRLPAKMEISVFFYGDAAAVEPQKLSSADGQLLHQQFRLFDGIELRNKIQHALNFFRMTICGCMEFSVSEGYSPETNDRSHHRRSCLRAVDRSIPRPDFGNCETGRRSRLQQELNLQARKLLDQSIP